MPFRHAIVRPPSANFAQGLTTADLGPPDPALALAQHEAYCQALVRLGVELIRLPAEPAFPDATFVEDTAVVLDGGVILCRPGAPTRVGEVASIEKELEARLTDLDRIEPPGTMDGGDVCEAGNHVFIGLSGRTNREGARQLGRWLERRGRSWDTVEIQPSWGILHLKSGLSSLGDGRLAIIAPLQADGAFRGFEQVPVPPEESYAGNCVAINGHVLAPAEHPRMTERLERLGYSVVQLAMSEFRKMDGGLSCLSLRW